ncbi:MAG: propanoyl-CoA acyltransferase [Lautropia sp. SCN 66-9]|nr:MAG: propanoyl-CoA acyltransferase [Lautropia sp. SCN 66-9]
MTVQPFVVGVGQTPYGRMRERSFESIGQEAVLKALKDAGVERAQVDEIFCGSALTGRSMGQRVVRDLGMTGVPITNVENACSSGSTALREACTAIAAGRAQTVLVLGIDQLTRLGGGTIPQVETDLDPNLGMVMPAVYAMRARRYLSERGATSEHLARVAVKAHEAGRLNPYAQYRNEITVEEVLASRMVADPLTLLMCCPTGDGAAAAVVTTQARARELGRQPIRVAATALQSGVYKTGYRDMVQSELTMRTAKIAYESAGIGPEDVDLAEIHDAFAIAELVYYEALGLCESGGGPALLDSGATRIGGSKCVNPSGGLLCRGHPVGATGIAQVCEAVWQLRGEAGARQVRGARVALTHCTGGGVAGLDHGSCAVNLLVA